MTKEELFDIWAPKESIWSDWAKPVLFAHITPEYGQPVEPSGNRSELTLEWLSALHGRTAIVVDLSGPASIECGLALAKYGYRPVPLFNAIPGPTGLMNLSPGPGAVPISYVDVNATIRGLINGAPELKKINLTPDAPPAFLLDAWRQTGQGAIVDGRFDNRSVSFPTDFPSSNVLKRNSIQQAVVVQGAIEQPRSDLAHTLLRWQQEGIEILAQDLDRKSPPSPLDIRKPSYFRWIWQRLFIAFGLHPNPQGGFGEMVQRSSGG